MRRGIVLYESPVVSYVGYAGSAGLCPICGHGKYHSCICGHTDGIEDNPESAPAETIQAAPQVAPAVKRFHLWAGWDFEESQDGYSGSFLSAEDAKDGLAGAPRRYDWAYLMETQGDGSLVKTWSATFCIWDRRSFVRLPARAWVWEEVK